MKNWKVLVIAALFLAAASLPFYTGTYLLHTIYIIMMFMALAISWDMLLRAGQLSFGIAGPVRHRRLCRRHAAGLHQY